MRNSTSTLRCVAARAAAVLVCCLLVLFSGDASASGQVVWKKTTIDEVSGAWKIQIQVHLNRAPDIALMPVRFTFKPMVYYERALVDGRKDPVVRKIPLQNQQPIVESVDVGFMDPASGKPAKRTRFSFQVDRERGFEAGEYEVTVTDSRSGSQMGTATRLVFQGDNEVIDRRSIVFEEKPKEEKKQSSKPKAEEKELTPEDDEFWKGGTSSSEPRQTLPPPAHMREKPGCGCRVVGQTRGANGQLGLLVFAGLAAVLMWRRRS